MGLENGLLEGISAFTQVDGLKIHYLDFRPPGQEVRGVILMVHGFAGFAAESLCLGEILARDGYRMLAVDYPGCGLSPPLVHGLDMDRSALLLSQLLAWTKDLADQAAAPLFLAGHSMGGHLCLRGWLDWKQGLFAAGLDQAIDQGWHALRGIYLLAPDGMSGEEGTLLRLRSRKLMDTVRVFYTPGVYQRIVDHYVTRKPARVDPRINTLGQIYAFQSGAWEAMVDYLMDVLASQSLDGQLGQVDLPVRIIWGDKDKVLAWKWLARFMEELPRATSLTLLDCGHGIHREFPGECARDLEAFIQNQGVHD